MHPLYNVDGENLIRKSGNRRVNGRRGKAELVFSARDSPFACRSKLSINVSWRPNDSKAEWSSMWRDPRGHSRAIHNLNSRRLVPHAVFDERETPHGDPQQAHSHVYRDFNLSYSCARDVANITFVPCNIVLFLSLLTCFEFFFFFFSFSIRKNNLCFV